MCHPQRVTGARDAGAIVLEWCVAHAALTSDEVVVESLDDPRARDLLDALTETPLLLLLLLPLPLLVLLAGELMDVPSRSGQS